jgi:septum formation protein
VRLLLASASPRRADLLTAAGYEFDVLPADVDESVRPGELPGPYVRRVAEAKAAAAASKAKGRVVLAADTVVVVDGQILGKPVDDADAARMLRLLSGRRHEVMTAVTLRQAHAPLATEGAGVAPEEEPITLPGDTRVEISAVELAHLSMAEIDWYVATGEPRDKAGAYAIQGLASRFVTRIEGSYSNVVGLPVALVSAMLKALF